MDASHQVWSNAYNLAWEEFIRITENPTIEQVLQKARELAIQFGFSVNF